MKKIFSLLIILVLITCCFSACGDSGNTNVINVYNWGQYIGIGEEDTINVTKEFTKRTGIKVNYSTYDSNETLYTKLKTGGSSIDVIIPSDYMIERLISENMLAKLNYDNIPNYKFVDETFKNTTYDPKNEYSVPYTFGTVGIIYNKKYVTETVDSWDILWNEKYKDKILMFDNPRDSFAITQSLLGFDVNNSSNEDLDKCCEKLTAQRPLVQQYVMDQIFGAMVDESAWIAPYYAGDFLTMAQDNENLAFAHPKEGFNYFIDAACIPSSCQNKEGAEAFINFITDPEISGKNMSAIGYATPISEARKYIDPEFSESEIAYPSSDKLKNAYIFSNLKDETLQYMDNLWLKAKSN